ncbi:MAG: hypothetical protein V1875_09425 [Candidatus Altiarchaeota archaeon]
MRYSAVFTAVFLLVGLAAGDDSSCVLEVSDPSGAVSAAVESCSNIGTYSIGGLYAGQWRKLSYQYPNPWKGTFASFQIDGGRYCTSEEPRNCTLMDPYVTRRPAASGNGIETGWVVGNMSVRQTIQLAQNRTIIKYSITNIGGSNSSVGVRMLIDTQLGENDGAPIYVPGDGLKTREVEYLGKDLSFGYWKAYNEPDEPTIVSTGTIDPKEGMTYPYRLIVADWKQGKDTAWDYEPEGRQITGDSAVIMYYDLGILKPQEEKTIQAGYGSSAPVLKKEQGYVGVTEVTLDTITGQYCPYDTATVKVDVLSAGQDREGTIELSIEKDGRTYFEEKAASVFPKDEVKTLRFNWTVPDNSSGSYTVKARRYDGASLMETKEQPAAINVDAARCRSPNIVEVGVVVVSTTVFVLLIAALGLAIAAAIYLWGDRGTVELTKYIEGEDVIVKVRNGTQKRIKDVVLEDAIPSEAEIRVHTLNAVRKHNTLTWEIGNLRRGETATFDYWVRGGKALNDATVSWHKGKKRLHDRKGRVTE